MILFLAIVGGVTIAAIVAALLVCWLLSGLKPGDLP